jgi:hypothetical protein
MQTLAFRPCTSPHGNYILLLHTAEHPATAEWREYVSAVQALLAESTAMVRAFVATDGGSPNATQRRLLADAVMRGTQMHTHVFTSDLFIRSVVTAFSWIAKPGATAHAPWELGKVCENCGVSVADISRELQDLQKSFPKVLTLEQMLESAKLKSSDLV